MKPSTIAQSYFTAGILTLLASGILTIIARDAVLFAFGIGTTALFFIFGIGNDVYTKETETHG